MAARWVFVYGEVATFVQPDGSSHVLSGQSRDVMGRGGFQSGGGKNVLGDAIILSQNSDSCLASVSYCLALL